MTTADARRTAGTARPRRAKATSTARRSAPRGSAAHVVDAAGRALLERDAAAFLHQSDLDAVPVDDPTRRGPVDRGPGRAPLHGLPRQQRAPPRARPPGGDRGDQGQLDELSFAPRRFVPERAVELAEALNAKFRALTGQSGRVLFTTGGSDAVEVALRLARAATGRFKTLSFWDAFHGAGSAPAASAASRCSAPGAWGRCCPEPSTSRRSAATAAPIWPPVDADGQPDLQQCRLACAAMVRYVLEREGRRRRGDRRAGAGGALPAAAGLLAGGARGLPRARHAARLRRDPDRPRERPAASSPPSTTARRPTSSCSARRSAAACCRSPPASRAAG